MYFKMDRLIISRVLVARFQENLILHNRLNDIDSRLKFEIRGTSNGNTKKTVFAVCIKNRKQEAPI